jgi:hypothetical protein
MTQAELTNIYRGKKRSLTGKSRDKEGFETTTFEQFEAWFNQSNFYKGCKYCSTTNERSMELYDLQREGQRPDGTRGGRRGKRLEIDRKDAMQHYDNLDNLVWACYWCNNAKSNFFTDIEFAPIAKEIGKALKKI